MAEEPVQGTPGDELKQALALLRERRKQCPGAVPVIICHDEIVAERAEQQAESVAESLRQAMVEGTACLIDPIPVKIEVTLAENWGGH